MLVIAIASSVLGPEAARGEVIAQFSGLLGSGGTETIQRLQAGTYDLDFCVSVIAVITLLVTA